jgi:hypothetical protein
VQARLTRRGGRRGCRGRRVREQHPGNDGGTRGLRAFGSTAADSAHQVHTLLRRVGESQTLPARTGAVEALHVATEPPFASGRPELARAAVLKAVHERLATRWPGRRAAVEQAAAVLAAAPPAL